MAQVTRCKVKLFPAPAGMNRIVATLWHKPPAVPRPRGDEPDRGMTQAALANCSPPPRG